MSTELISMPPDEFGGGVHLLVRRWCASSTSGDDKVRIEILLNDRTNSRCTAMSFDRSKWAELRDAIDQGFSDFPISAETSTTQNVVVERHGACAKLVFAFKMAVCTDDSRKNVEDAKKAIVEAADKAMAEFGHASQGECLAFVPSTRNC